MNPRPIESKREFIERIESMDGKIVGEYENVQGQGMGLRCADKCPIQESENFTTNIEKLGGKVLGKYVN